MSTTSSAAALAAEKALAQEKLWNRLAAGYYVCSIVGLIIVSIIAVNVSHLSAKALSKFTKPLSRSISRFLTGYQLGYFLVLPQWIFAAIAFIGLNVGLVAWEMIWTNLAYLASRIGWMALCNMCLTVFLGMKNTPLSPLAGKTYRDLNSLHRFIGYTTVVEVILHGSLFIKGLINIHLWSEIQSSITYAGAVAGVSMVILAVTGTWFIRNKFYETFFAIHVLFVAVILIAMGFHQPDIREKGLIVVIITCFLWALDRCIRTARWLYYSRQGWCTLQALPHGATKVTMSRSVSARPGSHALIWLPSVGLTQHHPFSMISTDPVEFIVAAHGDFTKKLHRIAVQNPGTKYRATMEGPYGRTPDISAYDKLLLICGGSGVTYAMALAQQWLKHNDEGTSKALHFVWVVRSTQQFQWFSSTLAELRSHPKVTLALHVTSEHNDNLADDITTAGSSTPASIEAGGPTFIQDFEKNTTTDISLLPSSSTEKTMEHSTTHFSAHTDLMHVYNRGRPIVDALFAQAMSDTRPSDRVLVTGAGPSQLLSDIQAATGKAIGQRGPEIRLHLESYQW